VADEVTSWVRLIMTLGHNESDIAIVFLRGSSFDAAWRGKDPISCGNTSRDPTNIRDARYIEMAKQGSFEAVRERDSTAETPNKEADSDAWTSLQSASSKSRERTVSSDVDEASADALKLAQGGESELRKNRMERQERELMVEGTFVKT
jgi:hypothetical protein